MIGSGGPSKSVAGIRCPQSGTPGRPVGWKTVAAMISTPLPARQQMALCPDAGCGVVYFGDQGFLVSIEEARVAPGYKEDSDGLVCYCFGHREAEIVDEVSADGISTIAESIHERVTNGDCACEVRNPTGKCCLGEVKRVVEQAREELLS